MFEVFALIIIAVVVQGVYATVMRPRAEAIRSERRGHDARTTRTTCRALDLRDRQGSTSRRSASSSRSGRWRSSATRGPRCAAAGRCSARTCCALPEGMKILPEDSRDYARQVEALPAEMRAELHAAGAAERTASLRLHAQHPGRFVRYPRCLPARVRPARLRAVDGALRGLGHSRDRLHRHCPRHRRSVAAGAQGGRRRRLGRRRGPRHCRSTRPWWRWRSVSSSCSCCTRSSCGRNARCSTPRSTSTSTSCGRCSSADGRHDHDHDARARTQRCWPATGARDDAGDPALVGEESPGSRSARRRDRVIVGSEAAQRQRSAPLHRRIVSGTSSGSSRCPGRREGVATQADLAHAHLPSVLAATQATADTTLLIAVPPGYTREQLGLLVGVANEAGVHAARVGRPRTCGLY